MATKINQTFYGNEANFATVSTNVKKSPYSLPTIVTGNNYSGGALDYSASPWGIGESSVSNNFSVSIAKGEEWTYNENNREAKNTPLFLYSVSDTQEGAYNNAGLVGADETSYNYELALFRSRIDPDVTLGQNNKFLSSLSVDSGASVNFAGTEDTYPITYLDYQSVKAVVGHVYYKPVGENTIKKTTLDAIISNSVSVDSIVYFDFELYDGNSATAVDASIGGNELELLEVYKSVYYEDIDTIVSPARKIGRFGYWYIDEHWYDQDGFRSGTSDNYTYYQSEWDTLGNSEFIPGRPAFTGWSTLSGKQQEFDDVSYHWEYGITAYDSNQWNINKIENGDTYASGMYTSFAYLELDDYATGLSKNEAYVLAILHELAFLGFPIVASTSHLASTIGDNDVFVPVFDEHLITTGEYLSGSESLSLPNATWGDIFSVDMPEYDPTYDPTPGPGPGPDDEEDEGDLTNLGASRQPSLFNVVTFYAMNYLEFYGFINELNDYYHGRTPEEWTVDFQGVNPAEYILGAYYTWFDLPINDTDVPVKIGRITLPTSTSRKLSSGDTMLRPSRWQYLTFGTKEIPHRFNDFRDYAPYTTIELYLPLAGTIELDTAYVMGHSITIRYYYSILTMTGVACVYRDDILYKTADVKIGSQIPLLSTNIGQYQNQITQLETARKQNSIRLATSVITAAGDIGSAIASGGAGTASIAKDIGNIAILGLQQEQLEYQLNHLAPSLSVTGAAEASNSLCCGQLVPKLIIKRAKKLKTLNDTVYSETVGNACCINDILGYVGGDIQKPRTGLVVCSNIDTTNMQKTVGTATTVCPTIEEINAIKQALSSGVYL